MTETAQGGFGMFYCLLTDTTQGRFATSYCLLFYVRVSGLIRIRVEVGSTNLRTECLGIFMISRCKLHHDAIFLSVSKFSISRFQKSGYKYLK